jgi:hypothetical protein
MMKNLQNYTSKATSVAENASITAKGVCEPLTLYDDTSCGYDFISVALFCTFIQTFKPPFTHLKFNFTTKCSFILSLMYHLCVYQNSLNDLNEKTRVNFTFEI